MSPTECQPSEDDYALRVERHECDGVFMPMTVEYQGGVRTNVTCAITVFCAPYQSIQDDQEAGTVSPGEPVTAPISISNPGADVLVISSVAEISGFGDTVIDSAPSALAAGEAGTIQVTIDTTVLAPGRHERRIRVESNANNTDERESVIFFGVVAGGAAEQLTNPDENNRRPL